MSRLEKMQIEHSPHLLSTATKHKLEQEVQRLQQEGLAMRIGSPPQKTLRLQAVQTRLNQCGIVTGIELSSYTMPDGKTIDAQIWNPILLAECVPESSMDSENAERPMILIMEKRQSPGSQKATSGSRGPVRGGENAIGQLRYRWQTLHQPASARPKDSRSHSPWPTGSQSVINIAGTGSYEPDDKIITAAEPSATMIAQRREKEHHDLPSIG